MLSFLFLQENDKKDDAAPDSSKKKADSDSEEEEQDTQQKEKGLSNKKKKVSLYTLSLLNCFYQSYFRKACFFLMFNLLHHNDTPNAKIILLLCSFNDE